MPDQSTKDLHIEIKVVIEQAGVNPQWEYAIDVAVPPAYTTVQEMRAFLRHQLDRAMSDFQEQEFEYSRSAQIIAQFDLRMQVIANLIKFAARLQSREALGQAIIAVIDMDRDELVARYRGNEQPED
jgi:hypothetical protein